MAKLRKIVPDSVRWIQSDKRLPKPMTTVIVSDGTGIYYGYFISGMWYEWGNDAKAPVSVTGTQWAELQKKRLTPSPRHNDREAIAQLCHQQWSDWMVYLFKNGTMNDNGSFTIPSDKVQRWVRQMSTRYDDLSPDEQNSDRHEADKFMSLFEQLGFTKGDE